MSPLQGWETSSVALPRAMPWAVISRPVGASDGAVGDRLIWSPACLATELCREWSAAVVTWAQPRHEKRSGMDVPAQVVESGTNAPTNPAMVRIAHARRSGLALETNNGARGATRPTFPSRAASAASSSYADSAHRKRSSGQDG